MEGGRRMGWKRMGAAGWGMRNDEDDEGCQGESMLAGFIAMLRLFAGFIADLKTLKAC